jgi:hypothetical protein
MRPDLAVLLVSGYARLDGIYESIREVGERCKMHVTDHES